MLARSPRRVKFVRTVLQELGDNRCLAEVELRAGDKSYMGRHEGTCKPLERFRSAALATAGALHELGHKLSVEAVERLETFGQPAVAVQVNARHKNETRTLVGFSLVGDDGPKAVTFAVLNATNRFLETG